MNSSPAHCRSPGASPLRHGPPTLAAAALIVGLLAGDAAPVDSAAAGGHRRLMSLPESAFGLAVTDERVYVPNPWGSEVWVVDRRQGRLVQPIAVWGVAPSASS
jgi:hypothetical protein